MASVTTYTADYIDGIVDATVVGGAIVDGDLILTKHDGSTVNGGAITVDKEALELDQVDNTSDADKPISTATQAALDNKADAFDMGLITGLCINITDIAYGAVGDDSTNNTTSIQEAADAAAVTAGLYGTRATLFVPPGIFRLSGVILDTRVAIKGQSRGASTLKLIPSAADGAILIRNKLNNEGGAADAQVLDIQDLTLEGNKGANTSSTAWQCGIVLLNDTPSGGDAEYTDGRHYVNNLLIKEFTGDGLVQNGRGAGMFTNISVFDCNGFGFNVGVDNYLTGCDAGACGIDGFLIQGNCEVTGCKAWYNGWRMSTGTYPGTNAAAVNVTPPTFNFWDGSGISGQVFSYDQGFGSGFHWASIDGSTYDGNWSGGIASGCSAQDNSRNGFRIDGGRITLTGCEADSNNNCGVTNGTAGGTSLRLHAGFDIPNWSGDITLEGCIAWDRSNSVSHQAAGLYLSPNASNCRISMIVTGVLNNGTTRIPFLAPSSAVGQNKVQFNGQGGGIKTWTWAASTPITPDPFAAETHVITLGGAQTINAPQVDAGSNLGTEGTVGYYKIAGSRWRMIINQDATGSRAVTWGSGIRINSKTVTTTASSTTVIDFIFDGTNWQAIS